MEISIMKIGISFIICVFIIAVVYVAGNMIDNKNAIIWSLGYFIILTIIIIVGVALYCFCDIKVLELMLELVRWN